MIGNRRIEFYIAINSLKKRFPERYQALIKILEQKKKRDVNFPAISV